MLAEELLDLLPDPIVLADQHVPTGLEDEGLGGGEPTSRMAHDLPRLVGVVGRADQQHRHLQLLDREVGRDRGGGADVVGQPQVASAGREEPIYQLSAKLRRDLTDQGRRHAGDPHQQVRRQVWASTQTMKSEAST